MAEPGSSPPVGPSAHGHLPCGGAALGHLALAALVAILALLAILAILAIPAVEGAPEPPPFGDWNIGTGEVVQQSNRTFDLRGDLNVRGGLTLVDCTLWVWSTAGQPRVLDVHPSGSLALLRTEVGPGDALAPYVIRAEEGSGLSLVNCTIYGAGVGTASDGRDSGVHIATACSITGTVFDHCYAGLWLQADDVSVEGCTFIDCLVGVAVVGARSVMVEGCTLIQCDLGIVSDTSGLELGTSRLTGCGEAVIAFSSDASVSGCSVQGFLRIGIGLYGSQAYVSNTSVQGGDGDGLVVSGGMVHLADMSFSGCINDVRVVSAEVWSERTSHEGTEDAAMLTYRSTVHIDGMSTVDSYWGVRARWSKGEVRHLTTQNATYAIEAVFCEGLLVERLDVVGNATVQAHQNARGIYAVDSTLEVRNSTIYNTRNGLYLDGARGLVENVTVQRCTREGIIVRMCTDLVLRHVNVTAAIDGILFTVYSASRAEECLALANRAVGFNFTSGARDTLVECNASGSPVGANVYLAAPRLVGCTLYMRDPLGRPFPMSIGLRSEEGAPAMEGGTIVGAMTGAYLILSHARLTNVTFLEGENDCVTILDSPGDVVEGCLITGLVGCSGIDIVGSSPVLRGNHFIGLLYGISIYNGSSVSIIDNLIEYIDWDGVFINLNSSAMLDGNTIRDCRSYGLFVGYDSFVTSRDDTIERNGEANVFAYVDSTLDMEGCRLRGSSIGVHTIDAPHVRIAYCEIRDNNQGIRAERVVAVGRVELVVEGCYFNNHSAYAIGAVDTDLTVMSCTFLDNMGGIQVWGPTAPVRIEDCTLVGSWLFGLSVDEGRVDWQVYTACRILSSNIEAAVDMTVHIGARLDIEDSKVTLGTTAGYWQATGATLSMRKVTFTAPGGCPFKVVGGSVELVNSTFEGLGPAWDAAPQELGLSMVGCDLVARQTTFHRTRAGLSMRDTDALLDGVVISECEEHGLLADTSTLTMRDCIVELIALGPCVQLEESTLLAERTELALSRSGLVAGRGTARLLDCSIGGMLSSCVDLKDGDVVLVNSSHVEDQVYVTGGGRLEAWWYVSAHVVWANVSELPMVEVTIEDGAGRLVKSATPDAAGRVAPIAVLAYEATSSGATPWGPHHVIARLHDFEVRVRVELVSSVEVELRLLDETPPVIIVVAPTSTESWQTSSLIEVHGVAADAGSGTRSVEARLDFERTFAVEDTAFYFALRTTSGRHVVTLTATDWSGNTANLTMVVWVETSPLALAVTTPMDGIATNASSIEVAGIVSRPSATVRINGALATVTVNRFTLRYTLSEGLNSLSVVATDVYGHRAVQNLSIWVDRKAPELTVSSPLVINTTMGWVTVEGRAGADANVTVNNVPVLLWGGAFDVRYPVGMGESMVVVRATDGVGNEVVVRIIVDRLEEEEPPQGPNWWEALPFVLLIPLLMAVVWYVIERPDRWGDRR